MEWQPKETAPKDGTKILVYNERFEDYEITEWYVIEQYHFEDVGGGLYRKVIDSPTEGWNGNYFDYWMSLPTPPK